MSIYHLQIATYVAAIAGYFAAHAAGWLTKAHAPAWVLGAITVFLSTLAGVLPTVAWRADQTWHTYLVNVIVALGLATLGHKSQIPTALKNSRHPIARGIIGVPPARRRHPADAGFSVAGCLIGSAIILAALILGLGINLAWLALGLAGLFIVIFG